MNHRYVKINDEEVVLDIMNCDSALELIKCIFLMNKEEIIKELAKGRKRE